jgi:hypothetical protein
MLNKWTILFQIKEARDKRTKIIVERNKRLFREYVTKVFFTPSPFLSRLKYK